MEFWLYCFRQALCIYRYNLSLYSVIFFQAITSMEEKGLQDDPRYNQLVGLANRNKAGSQGDPRSGTNTPTSTMDDGQGNRKFLQSSLS